MSITDDLISLQCDMLREHSKELRETAKRYPAPHIKRKLNRYADDLRDAADTILQLRDRLLVMRDELDFQIRDNWKQAVENERLRELVRKAIYARDDADWASIVSTAIALGVEVDG